MEFTDPREATKREAKELNDKGVDIIIVLSHCGLEVDKLVLSVLSYELYVVILLILDKHRLCLSQNILDK